MLTPGAFRSLALALPDAVEGSHHGHPDFRANGRIFASLQPDGVRAMVKVSPEQQRALVGAEPDVFAPASGAWGRAGCTIVSLAGANRGVVADALRDAWQVAMAQPQGRATVRATKKAASKKRR